MSQFSKSSCPKCGSVLKNWHRSYITFGNPFVRCNSCEALIRMSDINEWEAMSVITKGEYHIRFYGQAILFGGMGAVFLV